MAKDILSVRKAFADLGLTPEFADTDYKNRNSTLAYRCRCGALCKSTYRRIMLGMEACQPCINEKRRQTNRQRYGVDAPLQNEAIRAAAAVTNRERYGADTPLESDQVRAKIRETVRARYGVDHALQSQEIQVKTKATVLERYGVTSTMQHLPTHRKQLRAAFRLKEYQLPTGEVIEYQGYENYCLDELLAEGVSSEELLEGYKTMPAITYEHEGKHRVYHPDVHICAKNGGAARLVEVKSSWTVKADRPVMLAKLRASAAQGYAIELRVYSQAGARLWELEGEALTEAFGQPPALGALAPEPTPESAPEPAAPLSDADIDFLLASLLDGS